MQIHVALISNMSLIPRQITSEELAPSHSAFSRYYIRALSGAADRTVPRESQFTRLVLANTHMTDADVEALCTALTVSFETHGAFGCSLSLLEEIDISENPALTVDSMTRLFDTLYQISSVPTPSCASPRRMIGTHHLQTIATLSMANSSATQSNAMDASERETESDAAITPSKNARPGDACNALWRLNAGQTSPLSTARTTRSLATSVIRFLRLSRALFDVTLPSSDAVERAHIEQSEASDKAARRSERILKNIESALDSDTSIIAHPLDDRFYFWAEDVPMNALVNRFPSIVKDRVLAAMIRHSTDALSLMNAAEMDLSGPLTVDDTNRTHPKIYSVDSARFLANILSCTNLVTMVDLSTNNRGDESAKALSEFLRVNTSVLDLRLRSNDIHTEGGLALAEALAANTSLVEMDLSDNSCSDMVAEAFKDLIVSNTSRVGFVNWDRNCVSPSLVADVNYQLMLNAQPRLVRETILRLGRKDPQLSRILWNTSDPVITDNTVKVLMQSIRGNGIVTHIDVSNSKLTNEGARYLAEIVSSCPNLQSVVAQFNNIGDEGALVLLHALPSAKRMERMDLKHQQPRGVSSKILLAIEQISNLSGQPFVIRKNGLSLVVNDPNCTEIDLSASSNEQKVTDETVKTLVNLMGTGNTNVSSISLSGNRFRVTGASVPLVASIAQHLTSLDLSGLYLKDSDIITPLGTQFLARQPSPRLRELNLSDNQLTRASSYEFAIIARNCNDVIQTICFDGNSAISNQDRDVVEFYCGVNRYPKAFKEIVLDVEANEKPQLTTLNFTVVERTSQQGTSHRFSKEFDDHSARLLCIALAQNNTVHKVIFSGNRCTDVGATYWAQLLRVNTTIHHLDISFNAIGVGGLTEIAEALEQSHAIKAFGFEGNPGAKDVAITRRLLAAVRRSGQETGADRTPTFVTAHSVSNTHHAQALRLSYAQAAVLDKQLEDAIMDEAMAGYTANREKVSYRRQQEQRAASQLTRQKDASAILAPLTVGSYADGIQCVPSYLIRDSNNRVIQATDTPSVDACRESQ